MVVYLCKHYLRLYLRSTSLVAGVVGFALLLVVVASLAFRTTGMSSELQRSLTPGMIWLVLLFSLTMLLHLAAEVDSRNGLLNGFAASPVAGSDFYIAKLLATFCLVSLINSMLLVSHQVFFGIEFGAAFWPIYGISLLFALGYLSLGILLSHLSSRITGREVLFPLLLFPVSIPAVVASISLSRIVLSGQQIALDSLWLGVLLSFAAMSGAIGWLLFEEVIEG